MEAVIGIFVASLVGSPHCAAMCGPFLAFAAAGESRTPRWITTGAYHGGRLIAYLTLGVVAGALGAGVEHLGALAGVSRAAAIVAGTLMVLWGVDTILGWRGQRSRLHPPPVLQQALSQVTRCVAGMSGAARGGITGLATALLPCGWLYAFVAAAASTGAPFRGALVMVVFWAGTLPLMVTLGFGFQRLAGPLRRALPLMSATLVVAIGLLTIAGRLRPIAAPHSHEAAISVDHR